MTTTSISHAKATASLLDLAAVMDKYTANTSTSDDATTTSHTKPTSRFMNRNHWENQGGDNNNIDSDDDPTEQEQFNRISGILTQLIQEANNAIHNRPSAARTIVEKEETDEKAALKKAMESMNQSAAAISTFLPETIDSIQRTSSNDTLRESRRRSRLPRPTKLPSESDLSHSYYPRASSSHVSYTSITHSNDDSNNDDSNSNNEEEEEEEEDDDEEEEDLFSSISSNLTTPMSRTISPLLFEKQETDTEPQEDDPLMASFERLDSSLAMVDFLSRDLANYRRQHPRSKGTKQPLTTDQSIAPRLLNDNNNNNNNIYADKHHGVWTRLLILPLLYIPYSFILPFYKDLVIPVQALINKDPFILSRPIATIELFTSTAGLTVFIILMVILQLLRTSNYQCTSRQFITNKDRSNV